MSNHPKRPSGPAFNPNRIILDLPTIETARLTEAAKQHRKTPSLLAALVLSDWIKRNTPEPTLDGKPSSDLVPSRTDELVKQFSSPEAAPVAAHPPDTSEAIRRLENRPSRPRPFGLI